MIIRHDIRAVELSPGDVIWECRRCGWRWCITIGLQLLLSRPCRIQGIPDSVNG